MRFAPLLALFLAGCATALVVPYAPIVLDRKAFDADVASCRAATKDYRTRFDVVGIGESGASAAAKAIPQGAVAPLAIPLSAVGAATSAAIDGLGLSDRERTVAFLKCVDRETEWDRSAVFADPRE